MDIYRQNETARNVQEAYPDFPEEFKFGKLGCEVISLIDFHLGFLTMVVWIHGGLPRERTDSGTRQKAPGTQKCSTASNIGARVNSLVQDLSSEKELSFSCITLKVFFGVFFLMAG